MQNPGARWLGKAIGTQSSKGSPIAGDPGREEATRDETKRTGTIGTVSGGAEGAAPRGRFSAQGRFAERSGAGNPYAERWAAQEEGHREVKDARAGLAGAVQLYGVRQCLLP